MKSKRNLPNLAEETIVQNQINNVSGQAPIAMDLVTFGRNVNVNINISIDSSMTEEKFLSIMDMIRNANL